MPRQRETSIWISKYTGHGVGYGDEEYTKAGGTARQV